MSEGMLSNVHGVPTPGDLAADAVFTADNPLLLRQLEQAVGTEDLGQQMERWYRFVRDAIRYDPFAIELGLDALSAVRTLENKRGHCIHRVCSLLRDCGHSVCRPGSVWPGSETTWRLRNWSDC